MATLPGRPFRVPGRTTCLDKPTGNEPQTRIAGLWFVLFHLTTSYSTLVKFFVCCIQVTASTQAQCPAVCTSTLTQTPMTSSLVVYWCLMTSCTTSSSSSSRLTQLILPLTSSFNAVSYHITECAVFGAIDRVTILRSTIYIVFVAMLWVYIVQCKHNKITRVLPYLLTAALGTTKVTEKHYYAVD